MKNLFLSGILASTILAAPAVAQTDLGPLNLPGSFASIPYEDNFEAHAGVIPGHMAVTAIEVATLLPDAEAWANIGQTAACINPFSGAFNLEMGMIPGTTNYHDVRNALVIGLDGTGYGGDMNLSMRVIDGGEESDVVDGVWLSNDGLLWYQVGPNWGTMTGPTNSWEKVRDLDLSSTVVDITGQFYLALCQEDNFPYLDLDGVGVDDIKLPQVAFEPVFSTTDLIGDNYGVLTVSEAPPASTVYYLATFTGLGSDPFGGITTGLAAPIRNFATIPADAGGNAIIARLVPASLSGRTAYFQGISVLSATEIYLTNAVTELID